MHILYVQLLITDMQLDLLPEEHNRDDLCAVRLYPVCIFTCGRIGKPIPKPINIRTILNYLIHFTGLTLGGQVFLRFLSSAKVFYLSRISG